MKKIKNILTYILLIIIFNKCTTIKDQKNNLEINRILNEWKDSNLEYLEAKKLDFLNQYVISVSKVHNKISVPQRKYFLELISKKINIDDGVFIFVESFLYDNSNYFLVTNEKNKKNLYIIFRRDDKWVIKAKERVDFNKINNNFDNLDFSICNPSRQKFSIITKFDHKKIQTKVKNPLCKEQKIW